MTVVKPGSLSQKGGEEASTKELKLGRLGEQKDTTCKWSFSVASNNEPPCPYHTLISPAQILKNPGKGQDNKGSD